MAGEKLVGLIKQGAANAIPQTSLTDLMFGTVTSVEPLRILIENRFEVDSSFLLLSPFCYEKKIKIEIPTHEHSITVQDHIGLKHKHYVDETNTKETEENEDITLKHEASISSVAKKVIEVPIWDGLNVGDKVSLLRVSNGQKYYVMDKGGSL
ncbi:DUF2577 domain-containing protein [Clostridium paraputrificum]|uniref:DUF2577 domain-containing protein n=1 Tax=Clostridium paraputrificum TaxID=29363 RepID=UPI003D346BA6